MFSLLRKSRRTVRTVHRNAINTPFIFIKIYFFLSDPALNVVVNILRLLCRHSWSEVSSGTMRMTDTNTMSDYLSYHDFDVVEIIFKPDRRVI